MTDIDQQFEQFWLAFPRGRKTKKGDAKRKFVAIVAGKHRDLRATPEQLIAGAMRYAFGMGDNHPYVMMPTTWLNGGCWDDEDIAPPANTLPGVPAQMGRDRRTRDRTIIEDLTNRSWAGDYDDHR